jgi:hypothetical protein
MYKLFWDTFKEVEMSENKDELLKSNYVLFKLVEQFDEKEASKLMGDIDSVHSKFFSDIELGFIDGVYFIPFNVLKFIESFSSVSNYKLMRVNMNVQELNHFHGTIITVENFKCGEYKKILGWIDKNDPLRSKFEKKLAGSSAIINAVSNILRKVIEQRFTESGF